MGPFEVRHGRFWVAVLGREVRTWRLWGEVLGRACAAPGYMLATWR